MTEQLRLDQINAKINGDQILIILPKNIPDPFFFSLAEVAEKYIGEEAAKEYFRAHYVVLQGSSDEDFSTEVITKEYSRNPI